MIIGIGGISTGGKSWIAQKIKEHYRNEKTVAILCQDDYTIHQDDIPLIKDHIDWEIPKSMDFDRFYRAIIKHAKEYDIVVAEGIFVFHQPRFVELFDKMIYLTLKEETFLERKRKDLRWGREPDWYIDHVWKNHFVYREEKEVLDKMLIVPGEYPVDLERVLKYIDT
ncbi:MAG: hypothetical protein B6D64_10700 [Bacteroidetes bacterium 4484_276]|nr:MAG: hypothetical protein B6D64_10700 [Bacteroidetes bacterium 4484_276]